MMGRESPVQTSSSSVWHSWGLFSWCPALGVLYSRSGVWVLSFFKLFFGLVLIAHILFFHRFMSTLTLFIHGMWDLRKRRAGLFCLKLTIFRSPLMGLFCIKGLLYSCCGFRVPSFFKLICGLVLITLSFFFWTKPRSPINNWYVLYASPGLISTSYPSSASCHHRPFFTNGLFSPLKSFLVSSTGGPLLMQ